MRLSEVSKRYAKALLVVAKQKGTHEKTFVELQTLSKAFTEDSTVRAYFENPMITPDQKVAAVKASLAGKPVSEEVLNALVLMAERNRVSILGDVAEAFQSLLDIEQGITRGVVQSAQPLSVEAQKELEAKIAKILNKKIFLSYQQDSKLLGGAIAHVDGWTFDDSLETHLKKLNEELNRRSN